MKKLSMLVAAAFAFVSFGAFAMPKAAESSGGPVATAASVPAPQAKAGHGKSSKKKSGKKGAKKAM